MPNRSACQLAMKEDSSETATLAPNGVLVLEREAERRRRMRSVLAAAYPPVRVESSLTRKLAEQRADLLVVDYDALLEDEREVLWDVLESKRVRWPLLLHSGMGRRSQIANLLERGHVCNIIARSEPLEVEELLTTVSKLVRHQIFGIEKYFSWGSRRVSMEISSSDEKNLVLRTCEEFGKQSGVVSRFIGNFVAVTDELLTNALFNAPVTPGGERRFSHLSRDQSIALENGECVKITFCFDGERLGVSATDPYGSLSEERLLRAVASRLRADLHEVNTQSGGAGIGLSQTFESVSQLVVNLAAGEATEVAGIIDIRGRYRDFILKPKSLNLFRKL